MIVDGSSAWHVARTFLARTLRHPQSLNVALLAGAQYAGGVLGFLTSVVAARLLGPADYGGAVLVMALPLLLWSFAGIKSVSVTTGSMAALHAAGRSVEVRGVSALGYLVDLLTGGAAVVLIWSLSAVSVSPLPEAGALVRIFGLSLLPVSLNNTSLALLTALGRFRLVAALGVVGQGIGLLLVTGLLVNGAGPAGMVIGAAAGQAAGGVAMIAAATYQLHRHRHGWWWQTSREQVREQWRTLRGRLGWNYIFITLTGILAQSPVLILGGTRGPVAAGYYRLASGIAIAATYLESTMVRVALPAVAVRTQDGQGDLWATLRGWTITPGLPAAAVLLVGIFAFPLLVPLLFGAAFVHVIFPAQILTAAAAVGAALFWTTPFYYTSGPLSLWTLAYAAYAAVVVVGGWLAANRFGLLGVALLVAVGRVLFTGTVAAYARRRLRAKPGSVPAVFRALGRAAAIARRARLGGLVDRGRDALDALCFRLGVLPLRLEIDGIVLRGFLRHRSFLESIAAGYEPFTRELFLEALRPGATIVDGGAHIGLYTVLAARGEPRARVVAFEPDPFNLRALIANVARNGAANAVIVPRALSDRAGRRLLHRSTSGLGSSLAARTGVGPTWPVEVATTTLDHELANKLHHGLVVKLDVEGAEPAALQGMQGVLARAREVLVILEVNPGALRDAGASPEALVEMIRRVGLQPFVIDEVGHRLESLTPALLGRKQNLLCRRP
ncbi:MAG: FkbM family methyltransferase [Gemmatimonadales bacterium]